MGLGLGLGLDKLILKRAGSIVNPFQNATLAFSLRNLGLGATNVVRVRRDSDNTEQDFTANQILQPSTTAGSLLNFVGAGNGFVTIWYDQAGTNNAKQSTANSQPKIVDSGSLILENGKPALNFDGVDNVLFVTFSSLLSQPNSFALVFKYNNSISKNHDLIDSFPNIERTLIDTSSGKFRIFAGATAATEIENTTNQTLLFSLFNSANSEISINGNNLSGLNVGLNALDSFNIGNTADNFLNGKCQEIIIYNTDQSNERNAIENNINNFYNIY